MMTLIGPFKPVQPLLETLGPRRPLMANTTSLLKLVILENQEKKPGDLTYSYYNLKKKKQKNKYNKLY